MTKMNEETGTGRPTVRFRSLNNGRNIKSEVVMQFKFVTFIEGTSVVRHTEVEGIISHSLYRVVGSFQEHINIFKI